MVTLYACSPRGLSSHKFWDESEETVWPNVPSTPPPPPPEVVAPIEHDPCANFSFDRIIEEELRAKTDARILRVAEVAREHLLGELYAHLPHCEIDWSLDDEFGCRVVGMECYEESFEGTTDLRCHLQTAAHVKHDALLAWEWVESPSSSPQPSHSLHQSPTSIAPAPETDFVVVEVDGELEAERAIDASQSAVAAESGIPVLNATSKTTTKTMPV
ncbi:hypothetical protein FNYG_05795 [Fusarium nygamai]|uniref:Uncharacterized protein n=1 Tax=Gibberella nygamai TaxID=42673 RepID=A0A2K0WEW2_GIBNY|nr:hypothetical protein FNYG_05795 [Fusarium nygamai]